MAAIKDVAKTIESMATKKRQPPRHRLPSGPWHAHADHLASRQSLLNLASNANKFTEKGTITIAAHQGQGERSRLDHTRGGRYTGIGMTPEQLGKLFREFSRLPPLRPADTAAGLGLVISRRFTVR